MAEQEKNIISINGSLAGLTFYKLNGKSVVRRTYGPSKQTINNNPAYKKTKNNNSEFAGATYISKTIRKGLGKTGKQFQDTYMASRLTGVCRTIIANGKGEHGKKTGNLLANPKLLVGFPLIKNRPINQRCIAKHALITKANRNSITLSFSNIAPTDHIQTPKKASHFNITLAIAITAPYTYHTNSKKYQPETTVNNGYGNTVSSHLMAINQSHQSISLSLKTTKTILHKTEAISVWLGYSYFQKSNLESLLLPNSQAMQCIAVL